MQKAFNGSAGSGPSGREFEIGQAPSGAFHGSNGRVTVSVFNEGQCRMRKRNAIKNAGSPAARRIQWLWAELDGVRAYVNDDGGRVRIVMTKQDLYP